MTDPFTVPTWSFAAAGFLAGLGFLLWMAFPAARARYARKVAREQGLDLDARFAPIVTPYFARRMRLTALGLMGVCAVVLVLVALGVPLPFEGSEAWFAGMWAIIPLITVGGGIGTIVSGLRWPRTTTGESSTGRLTPPSRADVVMPWEELLQVSVVALGAVLPVIVIATGLDGGRPEAIAALVLGCLGVIATFGWRIAADRVLRSRPISGDAPALAWSDALRSDAVRFGMPVPAALATSAYALVLGTLAVALESSGNRFGGVIMMGGVAVILVGFAAVTIGQLVTGASRRWQRRLHPSLVDGGLA